MKSTRIIHHPILGSLPDRRMITFSYDGQTIHGFEGETIAATLLANEIRVLRYQEEKGTPRGIYCNIGHCYECRVTVNGTEGVRACLTPIQEGMEIIPGKILPTPFKEQGELK